MFAGFDPDEGQTFFERKRGQSLLGALLLVGGSLAGAFTFASLETEEPIEEEVIEAEIANFEMEEVLDEEPEPEPEPPPPPDSKRDVKRSKKPTPAPEIANPDSMDTNPEEGEISTEGPGYGEGGGGNSQGTGTGDEEPEAKPEPKAEPDKPKKSRPKAAAINPDKPVERPKGASAVKQVGGNAPLYPAELKKRNITGKVKVRLIIYKDGSVKGATVLAKSNSVNKDEDPELYAKANKLLLKAVQKALPTWKFKPSVFKGTPITVYQTITIPFTLG